MMRTLIGMGALVGVAVVAAAAGGGAAWAAAPPTVTIGHAVARVTIIPEARGDIAVSVTKTNPRYPLTVTRTADGVLVSGDLGWQSPNCHGFNGRQWVSVWGRGDVRWDDMPQVVIRAPRVFKVQASGAVYGAVGSGDSVDLANAGCGDWTVADQAGALRAALVGSGDVRAGDEASADLRLSGSGDIYLQTARAGLTAALSGSGDVKAAAVNGPLRVRLSGSGDVRVHGGAVSDMRVAIAGSGDVSFGGVARSLDASIAGSGDVSAAKVTGLVAKHISGSGDVTVGR